MKCGECEYFKKSESMDTCTATNTGRRTDDDACAPVKEIERVRLKYRKSTAVWAKENERLRAEVVDLKSAAKDFHGCSVLFGLEYRKDLKP